MSELQPLARLTFATVPVPSTDIGEQGELVWLPLSQLFIDPTYQRAILDSGKANIRRMIEGFSWLLFGTVVVSRRSRGVYAIIDGQHRATAAALHGGISKVPCLIVKGGLAAEARAFSAINSNVTRVNKLQSFRASIAAGDEAAKDLVRLLASVDVTIAPYPKAELDPGETMALASVRKWSARNSKAFSAAMLALRIADPDSGLSNEAIQGTTAAFIEHKDWIRDPGAIGRKIEKRGCLAKLTEKAQARKLARGGTIWANFQAVFAEAVSSADRTGGIPLSRLMAGR